VDDLNAGLAPEEVLLSAIEKKDAAAVRALLESGVDAKTEVVREGVTRPVLEFAVETGDFDIATLLADHGASLSVAAMIRHEALARAASANHVAFARHLVSWGAHPHLQDKETGLKVDWWNPHHWMAKSPDFVWWWLENNTVDFGVDPGRPDACFGVQCGWLSFLSVHGTPILVDRVMDVFRGRDDSRLRRNWDRALSGAWQGGVDSGQIEKLTTLLGLGLVPPTPLVDRSGRSAVEPPALLETAIGSGRFAMARWLAQSPELMEDLRRRWPSEGLFLEVLRLSPDFRQWLLTLPLDWTATAPEGETVLHALIGGLEVLAPEFSGDLPSLGDDDEDAYERELERHYGTFLDARIEELSRVCPASMLDQEDNAGWTPLSLHPFMDDPQREQACARYRIVLERAALELKLEGARPVSKSTLRL
jgi:hypothetical protein